MISETLIKSSLFQRVEIDYLNSMIQKSQILNLEAGEFLFHQGEMGRGMYIIAEGGIDIVLETNGEERIVAKLLPDDFFGEVCMLKPQPRTAAVRANSITRLLYFDNKSYQQDIDDREPNALRIAFNIANTLVDRLKNANDILAHLKQDQEKGQQAGSTQTQREVEHFKQQLLEEGHF
jgi:CRP-like cAMP-binding protein